MDVMDVTNEKKEFDIYVIAENYARITVKLPNESDVDRIIGIVEGTESAKGQSSDGVINAISEHSDKTEKTMENMEIKIKKHVIIGIGVAIGLFILGFILTNIKI